MIQGFLVFATLKEGVFAIPDVEGDAKGCQVLLDVGDHSVAGQDFRWL